MSSTTPLFNVLPGVTLPVAEVTRSLAHMWEGEPGDEMAPSAFRAVQMNLVVHFGLETSAEKAREVFDTAIAFAQRYPCRVILLCPRAMEGDLPLEGKLFTQCYIGETHREMCCCEALMLGYTPGDGGTIENQVSIWIEGDLPVYYWFHSVPAEAINQRYLRGLERCRRVIFDSQQDNPRDWERISWPQGLALTDLAVARTLPVRQAVGQFFGAIPPERIAKGLSTVIVRYTREKRAEARRILEWLEQAIQRCREMAGISDQPTPRFLTEPFTCTGDDCIGIFGSYEDSRYFKWNHHEQSGIAELQADFAGQRIDQPMQVRFLKPEEALSEALFFAAT